MNKQILCSALVISFLGLQGCNNSAPPPPPPADEHHVHEDTSNRNWHENESTHREKDIEKRLGNKIEKINAVVDKAIKRIDEEADQAIEHLDSAVERADKKVKEINRSYREDRDR